MGCECKTSPAGCILAGMILGVILIMLLSSCGAVNVPRYHRRERLDVRKNSDPLAFARDDARPPVVRGDAFILALQDQDQLVRPY